jgi:hypothetical protein
MIAMTPIPVEIRIAPSPEAPPTYRRIRAFHTVNTTLSYRRIRAFHTVNTGISYSQYDDPCQCTFLIWILIQPKRHALVTWILIKLITHKTPNPHIQNPKSQTADRLRSAIWYWVCDLRSQY